MSVMASRPVARWLVPAGVLIAIVGGGAMTTTLAASADASLAPRTAAELLVDLQAAKIDGASGTVVERADLGLPAIPNRFGGDGSADFGSLITGSHTMRVWYSGPGKARVALLGALGESDIIHNGPDVWTWSSRTNTATHASLPTVPAPTGLPGALASRLPITPRQVADTVLAALDPTTSVTTDGAAVVAGRSAYELVLAPRARGSLIADVRIAIDATRHVPLRVAIYAKSSAKPAFEIGFTRISFARPDDALFRFTPPPGATIKQAGASEDQNRSTLPGTGDRPGATVIGAGWIAVLAVRLPPSATGTRPDAKPSRDGSDDPIDALIRHLPRVTGPWGGGRILLSRLVSVLLTDDGRVFIGAVDGPTLVAAASRPAAAPTGTPHR